MKLSIIIPVYKTEQTLRRCIDSIISQEYRDWQMILVDDASPDGSGKICDDYARQDGRIQVMHLKKNRGLSGARNSGIDKARGEYLTFVDSDDYIADGILKQLMEILAIHPDYDILEYPVYVYFGGPKQHKLQLSKREYTNMTEYWLSGEAYSHTYAWNKIYRREIFTSVRFPQGKTFEDVWTLPQLLKHCNMVATTDVGLYYYTDNPNGITRKAKANDLSSLLQAHLRVINSLHPTPEKKKFKTRYTDNFARYYASVLNIQLDVTDRSTKAPTLPILPYNNTLKLRLLHLLGIKHLCQLHRIYHKLSAH